MTDFDTVNENIKAALWIAAENGDKVATVNLTAEESEVLHVRAGDLGLDADGLAAWFDDVLAKEHGFDSVVISVA